jgi:hypothetical protein
VPGPALTQIRDTLYDQSGDLLSGKLYITNTSTMISPDGYEIPEGTTEGTTHVTTVTNGVLDVALAPNMGATPTGTSYSVKYVITSQNFTETWVVPQSESPVDLAAVRVLSAPVPSIMIGINQVTPPSGMTAGEVLAWNGSQWVPAVDGAVTSVFGRAGTVTAQTGDYNVSEITGAAPLDSPALTGTPTAPTPAYGDDTTKIATTAFVLANAPSVPVTSVFGRTGAVTAQTGDYTLTSLGDVNVVSPANEQVLTFDSTSGKWENQNAAGAVPSGTPVLNMGNLAPRVVGELGPGQTLAVKIPGSSLNCLPSSGKVRIQRGAGSHFSAIVILRTAIDSLTVIDSTAVSFGGSSTPTMNAGLNLSDAIALPLDTMHDYYVFGYNDSGDSSFWGLNPASNDVYNSPAGLVGGYITGDQTGVSTIPSGSQSPGYGCPWDAVLAA